MKKLIALLLAACLMLGLMTTAFAADEKSNDIVILYTNDVHCVFWRFRRFRRREWAGAAGRNGIWRSGD